MAEEYWPWARQHSDNYSSTIAVTLSRPKSRGFIKLRKGFIFIRLGAKSE